MDLPLFSHGKMLGLLRIFFDKQRKFKKNEIDFAIALAEQSSCAIDKARLIEDQKHKYDELALHTEKLSALGRMAAGIAHEINNPLGGILLFSSNLFKKAPEKTPLKEGLEIIIGETQRCKIIIQELLEFARDKVPEKKTADINEIINNSLNILENEFRLRHIKINADLLHDIKKCLVDDNQIRQVFVNLLLNAAHAIDNNGAISIKTKMDFSGEAVVMNIEDNGCGIPDDNLKKIFEPFFSTKKNGSGLGLAVSYSIIRNHHGTINVKSQVGKGSTFTITLPIKGDGT
jgi:signal transduction histidine kinase